MIGPSHRLPVGQMLVSLCAKRFFEALVGASTHGSDFYHQVMVSDERALSCEEPRLMHRCLPHSVDPNPQPLVKRLAMDFVPLAILTVSAEGSQSTGTATPLHMDALLRCSRGTTEELSMLPKPTPTCSSKVDSLSRPAGLLPASP